MRRALLPMLLFACEGSGGVECVSHGHHWATLSFDLGPHNRPDIAKESGNTLYVAPNQIAGVGWYVTGLDPGRYQFSFLNEDASGWPMAAKDYNYDHLDVGSPPGRGFTALDVQPIDGAGPTTVTLTVAYSGQTCFDSRRLELMRD